MSQKYWERAGLSAPPTLKECPFCGGSATFLFDRISCDVCLCDLRKLKRETAQNLIDSWNNRKENNMTDVSKARVAAGCDCGCNDPVATDPIEMLEFLANRFEHAGVSHAVAQLYAHDIRKILEKVKANENQQN